VLIIGEKENVAYTGIHNRLLFSTDKKEDNMLLVITKSLLYVK
jgi:hypothetical protein